MSKTKTTRTKSPKATSRNEGPAVIIVRLYDISPKTLDAAIKRQGYKNRNHWFQLQASEITGTKTTLPKPKLAKSPRKATSGKKSRKAPAPRKASSKAKKPKKAQEASQAPATQTDPAPQAA